jgi:uncharacterized delta-60 repeat protein
MNKLVLLTLVHSVVLPAVAQTYSVSPVFGTGGAVHVDVATGGDDASAHFLLPTGELLLAGFGYDININSFHVALARLDTVCGAPDPTFGNGGSIAHTHQQRTTLHNIAVQPDGRIVGCGMIAPDNAGSQQKAGIYRFMPDGAVDSSFNGLGYNRPFWDPVSSGTLWRPFINGDGTITCVGESHGNINGGVAAIGAMRFTSDGVLDPSFDGDGIATLPVGASAGSGVMRPDGRVLAVGRAFVNPNSYLVLAQWNSDGSPDTTFGTGGWTISPVMVSGSSDEATMGATLLSDGRLVVSAVSASSPEGFLMARFLEDGTVDSTYATDGVSTVLPPLSGLGRDHHLMDDGSTLQFGNNGGMGTVLMRDADGQVVSTFGTNGFADAATGFGGEAFRGGVMMPSGRIIGYGSFNGAEFFAARLTTDPDAEHFVDLGTDIDECEGELVVLDAAVPGGTYAWSDLSTDATLIVALNGSYSVTVTDANGCTDSDNVNVSFSPLPPSPVIIATGVDLSTTAVGDLQWLLDGAPITGATSASYSAEVNGTYTVMVTDTNGCSNVSAPENITTVGMVEAAAVAITIFPSPARDHLTVTFGAGMTRGRATAIDALGRRAALTWTGVNTLDVRALAPGTYTLELGSDQPILVRFVKE